jgi:transglutaminase-like putative cysteine protease
MKNEKILVVLSIIVLVLFLTSKKELSLPTTPTISTPTIPGSWDISSAVQENNYTQYLVEEKDFDYSDERIYSVAEQIKQGTNSAKDAIKRTALYTVQHVRYDGSVSINYCYNEKASTVLASGKGDCVSMSRLNTAILRVMGIPARTMGGCLTSIRCSALFAAIPGYTAQTSPIIDNKKRGFLHEYVEVWDGEEWFILESTSGQIFSFDSCGTYLDYGYDTNNIDRCTISDSDFINRCRVA